MPRFDAWVVILFSLLLIMLKSTQNPDEPNEVGGDTSRIVFFVLPVYLRPTRNLLAVVQISVGTHTWSLLSLGVRFSWRLTVYFS